jgi:Virulence protein RhuM family
MHIANSDKPVAFYNLDVIISVGYRVKSKRGTQFRQWATQRLKDFLVQGYAINQHRLDELQRVVQLISTTSNTDEMQLQEAKGMLDIITSYTHSFFLRRQRTTFFLFRAGVYSLFSTFFGCPNLAPLN